MVYVEAIRQYLTSYYILNVLASVSYVVLKTVHPICEWFFKGDEQCELSLVCSVLMWSLMILKNLHCI